MRNIFNGFSCLNSNINGNHVDYSKQLQLEPVDPDKFITRCDWMKKMRSKRLRNICLPGSHMAASSKCQNKINPFYKCQKLDIKQQLESGIRFLDTQLQLSYGEIWCCSYNNQNIPFKDFLYTVRDFVRMNKSEIVGLNLTGMTEPKEWGASVKLIHAILKKRIIPDHMIDMAIGDILDQGMNIFVCGIPSHIYKQTWKLFEHIPHIDLNYIYGPNEIRKHLDEVNHAGSTNMALIWFHAEGYQNQDPKRINFQTVDGDKYDNLEQLSACLNYQLLDHLKRTDINRINVLTMDFVHDHVLGQIIKSNELSDVGIFLGALGLSKSQLLNTSGNKSPVRESKRLLSHNSSVFNNSMVNSSFDFGHRSMAPIHFKESNM